MLCKGAGRVQLWRTVLWVKGKHLGASREVHFVVEAGNKGSKRSTSIQTALSTADCTTTGRNIVTLTSGLIEGSSDLNRIVGRDGCESECGAVDMCVRRQTVQVDTELLRSRFAAGGGIDSLRRR